MTNSLDNRNRLAQWRGEADAVIIGAGAGLSTSAGFTYTGKQFTDNFADFIAAYHFPDMYTGGFYPFDTLQEHWAYWSRYVYINRYRDAENGTYRRLLELVGDKDYFVLTTNVDHQFQKAGFDKYRLFYTQGDYGLFQCSKPCHDATFVQDAGWYQASERYSDFLRRHEGMQVLYLELGVGMNTPVFCSSSTRDNSKNISLKQQISGFSSNKQIDLKKGGIRNVWQKNVESRKHAGLYQQAA